MAESLEERTEAAQPDERDLALARDVFKTFTKTLKTLNVYPRQNPIAQKFIADLYEKFEGFLTSHEAMELEVSQFSMNYMSQEVFYSEERQDNLALSLFIDGVRGFAFLQGITKDEIEIFIDILKIASKGENSEDDIVTLLWEKELEHVRYFVPESVGEDETELQEKFLSSPQQQQTTSHSVQGDYSELTIIPAAMEMDVQPLNDDEIRDLRGELSAIEPAALLKTTAEMFFELMRAETEISSYGNYVKGLSSIADIWKDKGEAADFLNLLKRTADFNGKTEDDEKKAHLARLIEKLTGIEAIRWFMSASKEMEECRVYLSSLARQATGNLVLFLGEVEDRKTRHAICGLLAEEAGRDLAPFVPYLGDDRWYLVRNVVMLMGQSRNPAAVKYIEGILAHAETRVRKECMKALDAIGSPDTKAPLMKLLEDGDSSIRAGAMKALKRHGGDDLLNFVREAVQKDGFAKRPFSEKREFLEMFGALGKEQAFPVLREFFRKRVFFRKDQTMELRAASAYGLAFVPGEDAIKLLQKGTKSRKSLIREACAAALKNAGGEAR